jgi:hypothetical protein
MNCQLFVPGWSRTDTARPGRCIKSQFFQQRRDRTLCAISPEDAEQGLIFRVAVAQLAGAQFLVLSTSAPFLIEIALVRSRNFGT